MKKHIRWIYILVVSVMIFFAANVQEVYAASNPYPTTQDVDGDGRYEIPCTRFAWQQVYDNLGIALPAWGNAVNWWQSAINAGYATGSEPKAGAVAVWSGDTYGHVAYVTSGSGNTFVVNEGGRTDLDYTDSHGVAYGYKLTNAVGASRPYDSNKKLLGFIYPAGSIQKPWVEIRDVTEVTATEAKLNGYIHNPGRVYITTVGVYVWDGNGNLIKEHYEEINPQSHTRDGVEMWFYMNADLGLNLQSLPKFKYQLFAISSVGTVYTGAVEYSTSWYRTLMPVDIGTNLYAGIIKNDGWATLGNVNGNMEVVNDVKDASDIWHFIKQGDGSYAIFNCQDEKALTVQSGGQTDGTNIMLSTWGGADNQKWYIYGRWSGEYVLRPKYTDKVLDVANGSNAVGTNAHLWSYTANNKAQMFAIYTFNKVGNSMLSVKEGTSVAATEFIWTEAASATGYSVKILKGSKGNVTNFKEIRADKETSCNLILPEGYYEAYVNPYNRYSQEKSNKVAFTVKADNLPVVKDKIKQSCVSGIRINGISKKIATGRKVKLTAKVFPSNASNKAVKWTSSNTKVAKVDKSGIVTMNRKSGGKSVMITATATDGSKVKATYKITSMKGVVKKITISGKNTVKAGKTLKLKAKVTASKSANKKLKWTSSNKKYATVNSSGKVKALKAGKGKKVKITAMATDGSGKKKTVTIKIK